MAGYFLYKTSFPLGYYTVDEFGLTKLPPGAELVLAPSSRIREEALTEIDRFLGAPPYLDVRRVFQAALASGLPPSESVRKVHHEIGELSGAVWPHHFRDALGIDRSEIARLFIVWWPTGQVEMGDTEFNSRVYALLGNA